MKHHFQPQWCETRNKLHKENGKIHKYVEIKQHDSEQPRVIKEKEN